jgi:chitodextrinase
LLDAASKYKAINPGQVVKLVRDQVKMNEDGTVEVVDPVSRQTRYTDKGDALTTEQLVSTFLRDNAHFVAAGPAGSGSKSNTSTEGATKVDINKLDLNDPEQRALYKKLRHDVYKPRI